MLGFPSNDRTAGPASWTDSTKRVIWSRYGDSEHAGSVTDGSPVINAAWHRHPPKSISRNSQLRHGSGIHSVPRKRLKASDSFQIHSSECARTLSKRSPLISPAVGQGK